MLQRFGAIAPEREVKFALGNLQTVEADGAFTGYASVFGQENFDQELVAGGHFQRGPKHGKCGRGPFFGRFSARVYLALSMTSQILYARVGRGAELSHCIQRLRPHMPVN